MANDALRRVRRLTVRHWLPIVTICPVNNLPDLIYVSVEFSTFVELYKARKMIRKCASWKRMYMEDIAEAISELFPQAESVTVRLAFNRHVVRLDHIKPTVASTPSER